MTVTQKRECGEQFGVLSLTPQAQRRRPRGAAIATATARRRSLQRMFGCARNLIQTPQKCIRVTEIREDTNSTLRG
jgi:hypothetical protein